MEGTAMDQTEEAAVYDLVYSARNDIRELRMEILELRRVSERNEGLLNEYIGSVRTIVEQVGPAVTILMNSPIMKMLGGKKGAN